MAMSTFQKVTLATCLVLCVALLLPKMLLSGGRKDAAEGSGRFPSMMQRQAAPEGRGQRAAGSRANNPEAVTRTKGAGTGAGTGGKSNLAGQIIPVYGFGILLYILYILFKITSKGNNKPSESRFPSVRSENTKRKITDFELAQLQDKLRETELVMENIVSNVNHSPDRVKGVTADQEESLLQQLTEITRVMQEGQMVDDLAPEKKTQEDWEVPADYPEEPPQQWEHSRCCCQHSQHPHRPETETETERTQADGADPEDGCVAGGGEAAEGAAEPNKERESDFPAGSGEAVGPGEEAVGPGEEAVGLSEEAVGLSEEAVGVSEEAVGLSEEAVGLSEEAVGPGEETVGLSEEAVGQGEAAVGLSEEAVGLSEEAVGQGEEAGGPGEEAVGLSEEAVGLSEAAVGLSEEAVGLSEEAVGPGEEAVGPGEAAVGPGEAAVGPGEEAVGPGEAEASQRGDGAGEMEPGVPEDGIAGVLEELELTLKMTSAMEQEKVEDLSRATETEASCGTVRRRNKRRRAKKAAH